MLFARYEASPTPALREALIERFLPLARQLARRYQRPDESIDDLFQVASLGLIKAIDRFDSTRGIAFSSYAVPTILGEIKRHFRDRTWAVRVPRDLQELALRAERLVGDMARELRRQPTISELAERLEVGEEQVLDALEAARAHRSSSLDAPRTGDEDGTDTVGDLLGDDEDGYRRAEQRATLERLMRSISAREREVLRLRFEEDLTQAEIGELIGVSQMQVSRLIRQAMTRLRLVAGADADADAEPSAP
jgi:RNA polymerase sigma-B factor